MAVFLGLCVVAVSLYFGLHHIGDAVDKLVVTLGEDKLEEYNS